MIIWHGVPSSEIPVIVERPPGRTIPRRKMDVLSIPGKNGDVIIPQNAYENIPQPYEIHIPSSIFRNGPRLDRAMRNVSDWLSVPGYNRLEDSYEPDIYRMAYFIGDQNIENILNKGGRAQIEFICRPERWLKDGDIPLVLYMAGYVFNPTDKPSLPTITVRGSGAGTLTVGDTTLTLRDCNGIVLDSEGEDAYRGLENLNDTVTGEFPVINAGSVYVSWTGGVAGVTIVPRWWMI